MSENTNPGTRRAKKGPDPDLITRMASLGAQTPSTAKPARKTTPRRTTPVTAPPETSATKAASMPAEQPKARTYSARLELTTTPEQLQQLDAARAQDRIRNTARIRAMIALWHDNERIRKQVDKLAREWGA